MTTRLIAMTAACVLTSGALAQDAGSLMHHPGPVGAPDADASTTSSLTPDEQAPVLQGEATIDVVFVLDTTGSMGGLIDAAKRKIWSIANTMATATPRPTIRIGLVGYRDRGDAYVTTITPLTEDLDRVYADLMAYQANGGGDGPESVNQALHEAITTPEWTDDDRALKIVYLVGDAPPHMDYEQDVTYDTSCRLAAASGIIVNTIQCGSWDKTTLVWRQIARLAEGEYFAIAQSGGAVAIATPYDEQIATLDTTLNGTLMCFGDADDFRDYESKLGVTASIEAAAPAEAKADRAIYRLSSAGRATLGGSWDLIAAIQADRVKLEDIKPDELPNELRGKSLAEQQAIVQAKTDERTALQAQLVELTSKRQAYIKDELTARGTPADAFDQKVTEALCRQARAKGITIEAPETSQVPSEDGSPEPDDAAGTSDDE